MNREDVIRRTKSFARLESEEIYYETAGPMPGEALVFCHGLGGNHASWFQQVPAFATEFFVVTWDQRGFGRSTNRTVEAGPAASVRDLDRLFEALKIEKAHLVGQSMGGWVALASLWSIPRNPSH